MGQLQTKQLEKEHVQQWRGGTLPKIQQPVDLCPFTFCIYQLPVRYAVTQHTGSNVSNLLKLDGLSF